MKLEVLADVDSVARHAAEVIAGEATSGGEGPRPLHRRDQRRPNAVGDAARAELAGHVPWETSTCCRWTNASPPTVTRIGT